MFFGSFLISSDSSSRRKTVNGQRNPRSVPTDFVGVLPTLAPPPYFVDASVVSASFRYVSQTISESPFSVTSVATLCVPKA